MEGKDAVFWDRELSGFGVRVYPSGTKVYIVQSRARGTSKRIAVGRHGVISADQARRKAAMLIARIKAGENPDPVPSAAPASEPTVADLDTRNDVFLHGVERGDPLAGRFLETDGYQPRVVRHQFGAVARPADRDDRVAARPAPCLRGSR